MSEGFENKINEWKCAMAEIKNGQPWFNHMYRCEQKWFIKSLGNNEKAEQKMDAILNNLLLKAEKSQ